MIDLDATQQSIAESESKFSTWLFTVTDGTVAPTTYYWSTKAVTWDAQPYTFKVLPESFADVHMARAGSELGLQAPTTTRFDVSNSGATLSAMDFVDGTVLLQWVVSDGTSERVMRSWKFSITNCTGVYQALSFECEGVLQAVLQGHYPTTPLVRDMWPTTDGDPQDNVCVPEVYGTAYIPIRSAYISDARYYVLGPDGLTYNIAECRSPRELGGKSVWTSGSYTFTPSVKADGDSNDWKVVAPIIAKGSPNGAVDACPTWRPGSTFLDVPFKFTRWDTASMTGPEDVLDDVLQAMGTASGVLNAASFTAAGSIYTGWGLEWNGGFFYTEEREAVLARLLVMCHSVLDEGEDISLRVLSKTSQMTLDGSVILEKTFRISGAGRKQYDSGYVTWQEADEAQDAFHKSRVAVTGTTDRPSSDTLHMPFVQDSQQVQKLTVLALERRYLKRGEASCDCKAGYTGKHVLALQPDDVVTVSGTNYGGTYDCIVDSVDISHGGTVSLSLMVLAGPLHDWGDLSPGAISTATDDSTVVWRPTIDGPCATVDSGDVPNQVQNQIVVVGPEGIRVEGGGDIKFVGSDTEGDNKGLLNFNDQAYLGGTLSMTGFGIWSNQSEPGVFCLGADPTVLLGAIYPLMLPFEDVYMYAYRQFNVHVEETSGSGTQYATSITSYSNRGDKAYTLISSGSGLGPSAQIEIYGDADEGYVLIKTGDPTAVDRFKVDVDGNVEAGPLHILSAGIGTLKAYTYQDDTLADDATVSLPDATAGFVFVSCGAESGMWVVESDGTVALVAGTTNTAATDSDGNLCVYQSSTQAIVKNRLGGAQEVRIMYMHN